MTRKKEGVIPRRSESGFQDISISPYGKFVVKVTSEYVGCYELLESAVKARDNHRAKNNLPPAKY